MKRLCLLLTLIVASGVLLAPRSSENFYRLGDGTTGTDKEFSADTGSPDLPMLRYHVSSSTWQKSNDGTTFGPIISGLVEDESPQLSADLDLNNFNIVDGVERIFTKPGSNSIFLGPDAGNLTQTNNNNTAVGRTSLNALTTGFNNTAIGHASGASLESGVRNTLVGKDAGSSLTISSNNTFIGDESGSVATGNSNTGIGRAALQTMTSGSANVAVGTDAGVSVTEGSAGTFLGTSADASTSSLTNVIALGSGAVVDASNKMRVGNDALTTVEFAAGTTIQAATGNLNFSGIDFAGATSGEVSISAPATVTSYALILPDAQGDANEALINDGSGSLTWGTAGMGSIEEDTSPQLGGDLNLNGFKIVNGADSVFSLEGTRNIFAGRLAGNLSLTGVDNTGVGDLAARDLTTGSRNTAIGALSGVNIESGNDNTVVGFGAAANSLISGSNNTVVGRDAFRSGSTGNNTVVGHSALFGHTSGSGNTAIGRRAATSLASGSENTAIGMNSLEVASDTAHVTAIGNKALSGLSTGAHNTALGSFAGSVVTTGASNVLLGRAANVGDGAQSNSVAIGANAIVDASNKMRVGNDTLTDIEWAPSVIHHTPNNSDENSTATGSLTIKSGDKTAGTGDSGNVVLITGSSAGGTQGSVILSGRTIQATTDRNPRGHNAVDLQVAGGPNTGTEVASGSQAVIVGGSGNIASGPNTFVGGGTGNIASGINSFVGGGGGNISSGDGSVVVGGASNSAPETFATVGGGDENSASGWRSTVSGGFTNVASDVGASIVGGWNNTASANTSTVLGGFQNQAAHLRSLAGGQGALTTGDFDFVLGNELTAEAPSLDNVHFRIAGNTSNVLVGRQTNQAAVTGAENKLALHTILANNQSRHIGIRAHDALTASYDLQLPDAQGEEGQVLVNDGSGNLSWGEGGGGGESINPIRHTVSSLVGEVGDADQIKAGHYKETSSYPAMSDSTGSIYDLKMDADDKVGTRHLTNNGTIAFTGTGILGETNAAPVLSAASSQSFSYDADGFFNAGDTDFTADVWVALDDWQSGVFEVFFSNEGSGSDLGWTVGKNSSDSVTFNITAPSESTVVTTIAQSFANGSWHHFAISYRASDNTWGFYIDGMRVGGAIQENRTVTADILRLGARRTTAAGFMSGRLASLGYSKTVLSDEDVRKLYAFKHPLSVVVPPERQEWVGMWERADNVIQNQLDSGWLLDKRSDSIYWDLSGLVSGDQVHLRMRDMSFDAQSLPTSSFDSGQLSAAPSFPLSHGLPGEPAWVHVKAEGQTLAGKWDVRTDLCSFDSTEVDCDLSSLTIDGTHRVQIMGSMIPLGTAATCASGSASGLVCGSATQVLAGDKEFTGSVKATGGFDTTDGAGLASADDAGLVKTNRVQTKTLGSSFTPAGVSEETVPDFAFANLTVGRLYRIQLGVKVDGLNFNASTANQANFKVLHDGNAIAEQRIRVDTGRFEDTSWAIFIATATNMTFRYQTNASVTLLSGTKATLYELNTYEITDAW